MGLMIFFPKLFEIISQSSGVLNFRSQNDAVAHDRNGVCSLSETFGVEVNFMHIIDSYFHSWETLSLLTNPGHTLEKP